MPNSNNDKLHNDNFHSGRNECPESKHVHRPNLWDHSFPGVTHLPNRNLPNERDSGSNRNQHKSDSMDNIGPHSNDNRLHCVSPAWPPENRKIPVLSKSPCFFNVPSQLILLPEGKASSWINAISKNTSLVGSLGFELDLKWICLPQIQFFPLQEFIRRPCSIFL